MTPQEKIKTVALKAYHKTRKDTKAITLEAVEELIAMDNNFNDNADLWSSIYRHFITGNEQKRKVLENPVLWAHTLMPLVGKTKPALQLPYYYADSNMLVACNGKLLLIQDDIDLGSVSGYVGKEGQLVEYDYQYPNIHAIIPKDLQYMANIDESSFKPVDTGTMSLELPEATLYFEKSLTDTFRGLGSCTVDYSQSFKPALLTFPDWKRRALIMPLTDDRHTNRST